jgi:hypothetical protein
MAETYDLIQSLTVTGSSDTASFTSIPGTYTDLIVQGNFTQTMPSASCDIDMRFNSDTAGNYYQQGAGSNTTPLFRSEAFNGGSVRVMGLQNSQTTGGENNPNFIEVHIAEYANSYTKNGVNSWAYVVGTATANVGFGAFQWRSTSAITRIDFKTTNGGLLTGTINLYGILAGNA